MLYYFTLWLVIWGVSYYTVLGFLTRGQETPKKSKQKHLLVKRIGSINGEAAYTTEPTE